MLLLASEVINCARLEGLVAAELSGPVSSPQLPGSLRLLRQEQ